MYTVVYAHTQAHIHTSTHKMTNYINAIKIKIGSYKLENTDTRHIRYPINISSTSIPFLLCVFMCAYMHVCMHLGARGQSQVLFFTCCPPGFFETGLLPGVELAK